jgi:protein associated with RNAse G/E
MEITDIISYKHDGELHRVWKNVIVLSRTEDEIVILNDKVDVIDGDGRRWKTREPAICFFYKQYWFNIICMLRGDEIYYYCNLSSPYVLDQEGIKYVDYDLDVKVFPDGEIVLLDRDEYDFNIKDKHYPQELTEIIRYNLELLLGFIKEKKEPFNRESALRWYKHYLKMPEKKKN